AAALLLFTAVAQAQPYVGPEIALAPTRHTSLFWTTPVAVAPAKDGFVIAWSVRGDAGTWRVQVARADGHGALIGAPPEMQPVSPQPRSAADPSIAPFGDGFLVAWSEDCGELPPVCTVLRRLDASLNVVAPDYPRLPGGWPVMLRTTGTHAV